MSLRKAIEHNKEHRKPYYGSKDFDKTCRNHGGCPWCEENRKHKNIVRRMVLEQKEKEYSLNNLFDENELTDYEEYCYKWGFPID